MSGQGSKKYFACAPNIERQKAKEKVGVCLSGVRFVYWGF